MFVFLKPNYYYHVTCSDTIRTQRIRSSDQLVNFVIGVNNNLIDTHRTGYLLMKKEKEHKKGNQTIVSLRLDLPILEDNPYFETILSPFQSKKPVPSMVSPLEEVPPEKEKERRVIDFVPSPPKREEDVEQEEAGVPPVVTMAVNSPDDKHSHRDKISILKEQLRAKERQIEQLRSEQSKVGVSKFDASGASVPHQEVTRDMLNSLLNQEVQKLTQELTACDQRAKIKETIEARISVEKQKKIVEETSLIEAKRTVSIQEEKDRFDKRLEEIDHSHRQETSQMTERVSKEFDDKCQSDIAIELERQTSALQELIKKKEDNLMTWQTSLTSEVQRALSQLEAQLSLKDSKKMTID